MAKIFISYRREDSQHAVDRLQEAMRPYLKNPARDLFIDVDNIPIGVDFEAHLQSKVSQCDAVLAVIGPAWLNVRNEDGELRLQQAEDFVRTELETALNRGIPVVPVLLDGTTMPRPDQLPDGLTALTKRNGAQLDRKSFRSDVDHIMKGLGFKPQRNPWPTRLLGVAAVAALIAGGLWAVQQVDWGSGSPALASGERTQPAAAMADAAERKALITRYQRALSNLEYYNGAIDGVANPGTIDAIDMFYLDYNLAPVDLETARLSDIEKHLRVVEAAARQLAVSNETDDTLLESQVRAKLIQRYQTALKTLGYYDGPINGLPDDATHTATKAFSKDNNITNLGLDFANLDAIERQVTFAEGLVSSGD